MKTKYWIILGMMVFFSAFSCTGNLCACDPAIPPPQPSNFNAVVSEVSDPACGRPRISFEAADLAAIQQITGISGASYIANQLPSGLLVNGATILVQIAAMPPQEDFNCSGGTAYPHIKVTGAWPR